jgi:prepilin-type N-terminal cleavage/methylation domain-containing protein
MFNRTGMKNKGFTLIELLVVIAIIALLIGILIPALGEARRIARMAVGTSNLKQLGVATQSYTADYQDRAFSYTWDKDWTVPDDQHGQGLSMGTNEIQNSRVQLTYILRQRGDIGPGFNLTSLNLIPHFTYSHVIMQDYLAMQLPDTVVVNPEDRHRMLWARDPQGFFDGQYPAPQGWSPAGPTSPERRHPYGASYRLVPAHWDRSTSGKRVTFNPASSGTVLVSGSGDHLFGGKKLGDVSYPSQKVQMYDTFGRHFGRHTAFQWAHFGGSRQPLLMYDASVNVRRTEDANMGFNPNGGLAPPTSLPFITYVPTVPLEPPSPEANFIGRPRFVWTRGGLRGVDFGGNEIFTLAY